jgi:hypothetical protein
MLASAIEAAVSLHEDRAAMIFIHSLMNIDRTPFVAQWQDRERSKSVS